MAILLGVILSASHAPAHEPFVAGHRSLWAWSEPDGGLVPFARRHRFDAIYAHVAPGRADSQSLRRLARKARASGVEVWAMAGAPSWAAEPRTVARWSAEVARAGFYAGMVLDVEPYVHPDWDTTARPRLVDRFLRGLERARDRGAGLPLLAAIPFWYDHDSSRHRDRSLLDLVLARTDGVIVLAYRDRAAGNDGILRLTATEVTRSAALGKRALIGVQTAADELDKLTFFEEGRSAMERELDRVIEQLRDHPGFGGLALHHYDSLRRLR